MNQFQDPEFAKASRVPFLALLGVIAVAGVVTWQSVRFAFETAQRMMCVWEGRDAAILFMVARRTIWQAVMVGGGLYFVWRMLKAKNTVAQIAALVGGFKMSLAVLFAVKVSGVVGLWLGSNFQVCNEPLACLHGWRIFQLAYLMSLVGVMPVLMALADIAQRKLLSAQTRGQGALMIGIFIALCLGLFVINPVDLSPHQTGLYQEDDHEDDEGEESESNHLDGYRLTEDEPWEIRS